MQKFVDLLHNETTWLKSPASTKYHLNIEGGLLLHSVGVAETLLLIKDTLTPHISDESSIIVGLFHDVGKVGMPGKPYYVQEVKDGIATGKYSINQELVSMGLALQEIQGRDQTENETSTAKEPERSNTIHQSGKVKTKKLNPFPSPFHNFGLFKTELKFQLSFKNLFCTFQCIVSFPFVFAGVCIWCHNMCRSVMKKHVAVALGRYVDCEDD